MTRPAPRPSRAELMRLSLLSPAFVLAATWAGPIGYSCWRVWG